MIKFTVRRILNAIALIFIISAIAFGVINLPAGDPATYAAAQDTPQVREQIRTEMGYNQPPLVRYVIWIKGFIHGDLGTDANGFPISVLLKDQLIGTLKLTGTAFILSMFIATILALITAVNKGKLWDKILTFFAYAGMSIPDFWIASVGALICSKVSYNLRISGASEDSFIITAINNFKMYALPLLVLCFIYVGNSVRYIRGSVQEVLTQEFIMVARSQGLRRRTILLKYTMKNAALPIITYMGNMIPTLINSAVIIEIILHLQGIGGTLYLANMSRDNAVLMAIIMVVALMAILANFVVDLFYSVVDPRIRYN